MLALPAVAAIIPCFLFHSKLIYLLLFIWKTDRERFWNSFQTPVPLTLATRLSHPAVMNWELDPGVLMGGCHPQLPRMPPSGNLTQRWEPGLEPRYSSEEGKEKEGQT